MAPHISLLDLSLSEQHAAQFHSHPCRRSSLHACDLAGSAAALALGLAALLLHPHTPAAHAGAGLLPANTLVGLSQAAQLSMLLTLMLHQDWHAPRAVNLLQRVLGLGALVHRFWWTSALSVPKPPAHPPRPIAPPSLLLEPLVALICALSNGVSFKDHVKLQVARIAVDMGLVLPAIACVLASSGGEPPWLVRACEWVRAVFGAAAWRRGGASAPIASGDLHSKVFAATLLTVTLGWLLPTLLAYYSELHAKLAFLREVEQQEQQQQQERWQRGRPEQELPGQGELLLMMMMLLVLGLMAASSISEVTAMWLGASTPAMCRHDADSLQT
jgi:hypothetical protein